MKRYLIPLALVLALLLASACMVYAQTAKPNGYAWVKTHPVYVEGEKAELIFSDVSDPVWARLYDINYVFLGGFEDVVGEGTDDIYFVANHQQWPVIEPLDRGEPMVSPFHEIHIVTWLDRGAAYPLLSGEDVEEAEGLGLLEIYDTEIVLNAPVVVWPEGWQDYLIIPQAVRAGGSSPFKFSKGCKFIKLPVYNGYVKNQTATFLLTDVGSSIMRGLGRTLGTPIDTAEKLAEEYGANYYGFAVSALANQLENGPDLEDLVDVRYRFLVEAPCWECPRNQWSVYGEAPSPILWRNKNKQYMPLRLHVTVDRGSNCSSVYRNADLVETLIENGALEIESIDGIVNSPTIAIPSGNALK